MLGIVSVFIRFLLNGVETNCMIMKKLQLCSCSFAANSKKSNKIKFLKATKLSANKREKSYEKFK